MTEESRIENKESPSPKGIRFTGSRFWLVSAAGSFLGSLSFLATALPLPDILPPQLALILIGGSVIFFMISILSSILGVLTLLLRGFKPDARLEVFGRQFSGAAMSLLLLPLYFPPWVIIVGYALFFRRLD